MAEEEDIRSRGWVKGRIAVIGKKVRSGLIEAEDGTLVEFDESAPTAFDRLSENDTVLFTLTGDEPDVRGVVKAQELLVLKEDD